MIRCVSTYAREEDMPGVLALLHVNERSREADSLGLRRKGEEGVMAPTSQAGLFPDSCQRITTQDRDWKED